MEAAQLSQMDLSKRLRELMVAYNLTVSQLAELGGVSKSAMEKYLAGPSSPRAVTIANICLALSESPAWLMFGVRENDEVADILAFTTSVRSAIADMFLKVRSDPELLETFLSKDVTSDEWRIFRADLPDVAAKQEYSRYLELKKQEIGVGMPMNLPSGKS